MKMTTADAIDEALFGSGPFGRVLESYSPSAGLVTLRVRRTDLLPVQESVFRLDELNALGATLASKHPARVGPLSLDERLHRSQPGVRLTTYLDGRNDIDRIEASQIATPFEVLHATYWQQAALVDGVLRLIPMVPKRVHRILMLEWARELLGGHARLVADVRNVAPTNSTMTTEADQWSTILERWDSHLAEAISIIAVRSNSATISARGRVKFDYVPHHWRQSFMPRVGEVTVDERDGCNVRSASLIYQWAIAVACCGPDSSASYEACEMIANCHSAVTDLLISGSRFVVSGPGFSENCETNAFDGWCQPLDSSSPPVEARLINRLADLLADHDRPTAGRSKKPTSEQV